jgi:hypothetical protein
MAEVLGAIGLAAALAGCAAWAAWAATARYYRTRMRRALVRVERQLASAGRSK